MCVYLSKKFLASLVTAAIVVTLPVSSLAAVTNQYKLSQGTEYEKRADTVSGRPVQVNIVKSDLSNPFTKIDVGFPNPLTTLQRPTVQANNLTGPGQQVTGVINGSFFGPDRLPMYLISYRNRLMNAGIIASGRDQYVNEPWAFGVTENGLPKIDTYALDLSFVHNGFKTSITSSNKQRSDNSLILFTGDYPKSTTETNQYGYEIVVRAMDGNAKLDFGRSIQTEVVSIRPYGDTSVSQIPKDGFVLSAHGTAMDAIKNLKIGEQLTVAATIDQKWMNSSFMLTSGPLLVANSQVDLNIDAKSPRATEKAPRSAIAIDSTGKKVWMVTVDGRQAGLSEGMTLMEFAAYLKSLGASYALNLDGGGSTALGIREPGNFNISLKNKPSDGVERAVSTVLYAMSTAPKGNPATITATMDREGVFLVGAKGKVVTGNLMDTYYNPVAIDSSRYTLSSPQQLALVSGMTFTASKAGKGTLDVKYDTAIKSFPFEVVATPTTLRPSQSEITTRINEKQIISVKAFDATNREVLFDPTQVTWNVTAGIGTITSTGAFTAAAEGKGSVTATLGGKTISIPVTVSGSALKLSSLDQSADWKVSSVSGTATLAGLASKEVSYEGSNALKVTYDFTDQAGTSAAYISPKTPMILNGIPFSLSARIYGDASQSWVRGKIKDATGKEVTIDFTEERGLKWSGWNRVEAKLPTGLQAPLHLQEIYFAQPESTAKTKGSIYFDDLKSVYRSGYQEASFKDTSLTYRAEKEVAALVTAGVIGGYPDGTFGPYQDMTRLQAAILLARAMNLSYSGNDPGFSDMPKGTRFFEEVAAVAAAGVINGKEGGTKFDPNGKLTRAEMAAILQRGFNLPMTDKNYFTDIDGSFAKTHINALAETNITTGIGDNKFGPQQQITRGDFSVFLYRTLYR